MFSRKYCTEVTNLSTLSVFEVEIWCYRGGDVVPKWIHRSAGTCSVMSVHPCFLFLTGIRQTTSQRYAMCEPTYRLWLAVLSRKRGKVARCTGPSCSASRSILVSRSSRQGSSGRIMLVIFCSKFRRYVLIGHTSLAYTEQDPIVCQRMHAPV